MIYGYIPKSKPKKLTKAQKEQKLQWLKSIESISPKRVILKSKKPSTKFPSYNIPPGRETPKFASLDTGFVTFGKTFQNLYTGDKIKGIGTMHKSNAVPIFSDEEAVDIAHMRR